MYVGPFLNTHQKLYNSVKLSGILHIAFYGILHIPQMPAESQHQGKWTNLITVSQGEKKESYGVCVHNPPVMSVLFPNL